MNEVPISGSDLTEQNNNDFPYSQHDSFVNKREEDVATNVFGPLFPDIDVLPVKREQGSKQNLINALRNRPSFLQSFFKNQEPGFGHTFADKRDSGFAPGFVGNRAPVFNDRAVGKRLDAKSNIWLLLSAFMADIDKPRTTTISEENIDVARPDAETYPVRDSIFQGKRAQRFERRSVGEKIYF